MTPTAPTPAATYEQRASAFAAAVRERLSDLPAEDLDDLLDGLQADLADRLADGEELGDPEAYAEELRQAAGLPEREAAAGRGRRPLRQSIAASASAFGESFRAFWAATQMRREIRDFVVSLRPVWWIARGVALPFGILAVITFVTGAWWWFYPDRALESFPYLVFTLVCVLVSIQWGRGRWAGQRWLVWVRRAASVLAAISLIPVIGIGWGRITTIQYAEPEPGYVSGLSTDGTEIGNIFAYDCNGRPLDGVQLFTRDGKPLTTLQDGQAPYFYDETTGQDYRYAQNPLATLPNGWSGWNVFPLQQVTYQGDDQTDADGNPIGTPQAAPLPFAQVPAVSDDCPAPDAAEGGDAQDPASKDAKDAKDPAKAGSEAKTVPGAGAGSATGTEGRR